MQRNKFQRKKCPLFLVDLSLQYRKIEDIISIRKKQISMILIKEVKKKKLARR